MLRLQVIDARCRTPLLIAWLLVAASIGAYLWVTRFASFEVAWRYGRPIQAANFVATVAACALAIQGVRYSRSVSSRLVGIGAVAFSTIEGAWLGFLLLMTTLMPGK